MPPRSAPVILPAVLVALFSLGCQVGPGGSDGGSDAAVPTHKLTVDVAFASTDAGVPFGTQNGSVVYVSKSELANKPYFWVTTKMGESFANATPLEAGGGSLSGAFTATFDTSSRYEDGAVELSLFISMSGGNAGSGPQGGDLGAFDLSPPPAGEPQPTGSSVRVHLSGGDVSVSLDNHSFIRF